ncbi:MAG: arginyltransferase [Robiginitomaculum sp.]|nr:MAG: arginyltransferase [Robiginitomaculum sp.]
MTRHFDPNSLQFYITMPAPCPYLPDQMERKVFTSLDPLDGPHLNDFLTHSGFRRSQNVIYRPHCEGCNACRSIRVLAFDFVPGKSLKRAWKHNQDITRLTVENYATREQFDLFTQYLKTRHHDGGMANMDFDRYELMVEDCASRTDIFEYRDGNGTLIACCITDELRDGLSMVYSFFDTNESKRGLGTYMILDHLQACNQASLPYLYLGYWVKNSPKMSYKTRFNPHQILGKEGWQLHA